jgi:hypothetical protein
MRWLRRSLVAIATGVFYGALGTSVAGALFGASASSSLSVSSSRIFPTAQSTSAWDLQDASAGGAAATSTDPLYAVDGRTFATSNLTSSFAATRYVEVALSAPLPTEVALTNVSLSLTAAQSGGGTACVYVQVRRASTGAVLGTLGSATTPLGCSSSQTQATSATPISFVTSSTVADDLKLRIFMRSSSNKKLAFDRVAVTGEMTSSPFTLYETSLVDASSGTASTTAWSLAADDATTYTTAAAWPASFDASRYLQISFPAEVPSGSEITAASLTHAYASNTGGSSCIWVEIYNGTNLLDTHGTAAEPLSCNGTTTQQTDVVDLPEIDSVTEANNVKVRIYGRNANSDRTRHGLVTLTVEYALT